MNRIVLATLAAGSALAPAVAADLPPVVAPATIAPSSAAVVARPAGAFDWTGLYAGVNAGFGFDADFDLDGTLTAGGAFPAGGPFPTTRTDTGSGFIAGAQLGYNIAFMGVVLGVETDIQYSTVDAGATIFDAPAAGATTAFSYDLDYFGTLRARLGYGFGPLLAYATGGFAYGGVGLDTHHTLAGGVAYGDGDGAFHTGYAVGGGLEYAFGDSISLNAEYLFADLGTENFATAYADGTRTQAMIDLDLQTVRIGLNYHF